jgi:polysaccharide pyruvyl transferase WcaK-like protein
MVQARTKIALLHHTGGGNLGDDATMDVVIRNIGQRWPDAEIIAFSMNPDDTIKKHGIQSYPIRRYTWDIGYESTRVGATQAGKHKFLKRLSTTNNPVIRLPRALFCELAFLAASFRTLRSFDQMIVSGGGQLTERSGPWGFPYAIFTWILAAKIARIKCVFLNVGAGPLKHPLSKFFVTRALFAADYVSFRDEQSQALAVAIGFTGKSQVFPDNVYDFEVPSTVSRGRREQMLVGIAPMPYPFCDPREHPSDHQAIYEDLIAKMAIFASSVVKHSYSLKLFGSDTGADPSAIEDMRRVLRNSHNISTPQYEPAETVRELLSTMATMDYVVTCRFHGVVFAHILNKPVLAIAHHPKVTNLMNSLGLSRYCVDIQTFDPIRFTDTFASLVCDSERVKSKMQTNLAVYKSQLAIQFDDLFPRSSRQTKVPQATRARASGTGY